MECFDRVCVIAEAGVNHNGKLELALEMVDVAAASGADFIKFQTFNAEMLATRSAEQAAYQLRNTGVQESQLSMLKRLELTFDDHKVLKDRCDRAGIGFLSSPFDQESLRFLLSDMGAETIKLGSGELTNLPLLVDVGRSGVAVILSTGMSTLSEIELALASLAYGRISESAPRSEDDIKSILHDGEAWKYLVSSVTVLHCTSEYPTPLEEVNLRSINTIEASFGLRVGYSDHTEGGTVAIAAVAIGARVIEKHFTLDRGLPGPDQRASIEPDELTAFVKSIRAVEKVLGNGRKIPQKAEVAMRLVARKSLVASTDIKAGELFTTENLAILRPGTGMSPSRYWEIIGTRSQHSFKEGELIY